MTNCTVSGNTATGHDTIDSDVGTGGGVSDGAFTSVYLTNCTITGNSAAYGGGLYNSLVSTATLTNCTVSSNTATGGGGGVFNFETSTATLTNCVVSGNSALGNSQGFTGIGQPQGRNGGGGVLNCGDSTATLTSCSISGNSATGCNGGGVFNQYNSTTTLTSCTVSGNSASNGGGISNQGTLIVSNSNLINNQATSMGGGLSTTGASYFSRDFQGDVTITDSVISLNQVKSSGTAQGGGIYARTARCRLTIARSTSIKPKAVKVPAASPAATPLEEAWISHPVRPRPS